MRLPFRREFAQFNARCDPTMHASCCRSQKFWMSVTTPFAAEKASLVLTCNFSTGCEPLFGSKTRTRPSQNVVRRRNRITHLCFPAASTVPYSVEIARVVELLCVHGEVAVAVAGAESPSETHTLGSYCDWRLTKR